MLLDQIFLPPLSNLLGIDWVWRALRTRGLPIFFMLRVIIARRVNLVGTEQQIGQRRGTCQSNPVGKEIATVHGHGS
jgi:hypothetical protein